MLPRASQLAVVDGSRIEPRYLTAEDYPWLRALLDAHARLAGRRRLELRAEVMQGLGVPAPSAKLRLAAHLLERKTTDRIRAPVAPRRIRASVFRAAGALGRTQALELASRELGITPAQIEEFLFADLTGERIVQPLAERLGPAALAAEANTALIASLLTRATTVRIAAHGNVRALVRHAKLVGLLCVFDLQGDQLTMNLSGPYALFRRTQLYGRALASLLPRLAWCRDFTLVADCSLEGADGAVEQQKLVVRKGDPIQAGRELRPFDSTVEERFVRDFSRLTRDWSVVREPGALPTGHGLFFPDFELVHRRDSHRRWFVEIVGFWTEAYLRGKGAMLSEAGLDNVIVCVDETKSCGLGDLPPELLVIPYRRRLPAARVLGALEDHTASVAP